LAGKLTSGMAGFGAGALNALLPGAGALLGPLLSKGIGAIGGLFNRDRGRDKVEDFAATFATDGRDGFDVLQEKLAKLDEDGSGTGDRLWRALTQGTGRNNPEQAQRNIDAVTAALNKHSDQLTRAEAAVQRYGFTFEELGPKLQRSRVLDVAAQLQQDWEDLNFLQIDTDAIINRMSDSVSEFLQRAIQTGTEVPLAMRPMIQQMLEAGRLIGANGEKLEDLEDVTWAKSMTQGFKDVTEAIYDLRDALVYGVGGAIDTVNSKEIRIRSSIDATDRGGEIEQEGINSFANGTQGYQWFGAGRKVTLHGWEKVTPIGKDTGGPSTVVIPVSINGDDYAEIRVNTQTRAYQTRYRVGAA
jgi:hypothetical protein